MMHKHNPVVGAGTRRGLVNLSLAAASLATLCAASIQAQSAPANGPREVDVRWHALVGATVVPSPGERIENATVVLRDGVIVSVASGGRVPAGARVWDYEGMTIYAGLVDAHVPVDAPAPDEGAPGTHWHARVLAQRSALDGVGVPEDTRAELRSQGFTAAAVAPSDGVFAGTGAVATLGSVEEDAAPSGGGFGGFAAFAQQQQQGEDDGSSAGMRVVAPLSFHTLSFGRGRGHPSSEMGVISLMRQTFMDADWHAKKHEVYALDPSLHEAPQRNDALTALGSNSAEGAPLFFETSSELQALRAAKIAKEFGRDAIVMGAGGEYKRLDAIKAEGLPLIVPVRYPDAPDLSSYADIDSTSLQQMMSWEQAPTNLRRLQEAGVSVSLTSDTLRNRADFHANVRKAIEHGLSKDDALAMMTTNPAELFGVGARLGKVADGYLANLVVVEGDLFDESSTIRDVWVDGNRYEISAKDDRDFTGTWTAAYGGDEGPAGAIVIGKGNSVEVSVEGYEGSAKARNVEVVENRIAFLVPGENFNEPGGFYAHSGVIEGDDMFGTVLMPDGSRMPFSAKRTAAGEEAGEDEGDDRPGREGGDDAQDAAADVPNAIPTPFGAYGFFDRPTNDDVVVTGATVWTAGPRGNIENATLVVSDGKIAYVGPARGAPRAPRGAVVIDASGKHVSPGIFDAHSHTGISGGVNEGGETVTAEVRIQDVINPDDVNWYRQLAGGLTAANQLHGSANPIGGQNSIAKIRWGAAHPDEMRIAGHKAGIKFALGENPKRRAGRYPDTRMGVEVVIRDRFAAATDYMDEWDRYNALRNRDRQRTMPPRRDLELEAMAEIIRGERLVHSHSYRQDEIFMLTRVAKEYGFTIGTFQHVLEGFKVAEAIKETAIGASTFSDWWAYKIEAYDAIPYNGAIMHEAGVPVTFNSDSSELARRLNTEAAKAVKYGGVEPEEAIKFVTYNAALQMGVDDKTGSLENGKDADFVIWSANPLSTFARAEKTFVDGLELFSLEQDAAHRAWINTERQRLIGKILASSGSAGPRRGAGARGQGAFDAATTENK